MTSILAAMFLVTSLTLAYLATHSQKASVLNSAKSQSVKQTDVEKKIGKDDAEPAKAVEPVVPLAN